MLHWLVVRRRRLLHAGRRFDGLVTQCNNNRVPRAWHYNLTRGEHWRVHARYTFVADDVDAVATISCSPPEGQRLTDPGSRLALARNPNKNRVPAVTVDARPWLPGLVGIRSGVSRLPTWTE